MIVKEIEKGGLPVALITAMTKMATQVGANRIVTGIKIPHPCGNPDLPEEADLALRREIVKCALKALQTEVKSPAVFVPDVTFISG